MQSSAGKQESSQIGDKTDCALLSFVSTLGYDYREIRRLTPESTFHKLYRFNSQRKWMATVVPLKDVDVEAHSKQLRLYAKGASEIILNRSADHSLKFVTTTTAVINP